MKKLTTLLLLALLLLATALPALASPTGASQADIDIWQTQVPAPSGELQKIHTVLGEGATPTIQRRLDSSQRSPVIDNTPRAQLITYFLTLGWRLDDSYPARDDFSIYLLTNLPAQNGVVMAGLVGGYDAHGIGATEVDKNGSFAIVPGETFLNSDIAPKATVVSAKASTAITITLPDGTVYFFPKDTPFQKLPNP